MTETMYETVERILETCKIVDNIWLDVVDGKLTTEQAKELIDSILEAQ